MNSDMIKRARPTIYITLLKSSAEFMVHGFIDCSKYFRIVANYLYRFSILQKINEQELRAG